MCIRNNKGLDLLYNGTSWLYTVPLSTSTTPWLSANLNVFPHTKPDVVYTT